jgi:tellurite resistance protein TehA-like permease
MVRAQFLGLILMSVALGMLVTNAFDNWLRGYTVIWWLALILVNIFAIGAASITVAKRIN